jgi:SPP1 gp7 family putative phage head morphogenesis protein
MSDGKEKKLKKALEPVIQRLSPILMAAMIDELVAIYTQGWREIGEYGKKKVGFKISFDVPPYEEALDWATKHCAKLITQIDDETKTRIAQAVSRAIDEGKGVPGLAKNIRDEIMDMTRYRSQMIARTETANALQTASLDTAKKMGATHKEWVAEPSGCEICLSNDAEGPIPVSKSFRSGDMNPAAHPNCRCGLAYSFEEN